MSDRLTADRGVVELIQETAVRASKATVLETKEPWHVIRVAKPDGAIETLEPVPHVRSHEAESLASLISFAKSVCAGKHGEHANPVVWYGVKEVALVVDDETRRDTVHLLLRWTSQLQSLVDAAGKAFQQESFIRFLRVEMAGALDESAGLIARLRTIKWVRGDDGQATVEHGKSSMGRTINAAVHGVDAIPEEVSLCIRVFNAVDIRTCAHIRCAIDINATEKTFKLIPLPMQVEDAVEAILDGVALQLTNELKDIPVYRGKFE